MPTYHKTPQEEIFHSAQQPLKGSVCCQRRVLVTRWCMGLSQSRLWFSTQPLPEGDFYQHYCCGSSLKTNVGSHISGSIRRRFTTLQPAAPQHRLLNPSFPGRGRRLLRHREVSAGWDLVIIYKSNCFRDHTLLSKLHLEAKLQSQNLSPHSIPPLAKGFRQKCHPSNSIHKCSWDTEISSESQQLDLSSWA